MQELPGTHILCAGNWGFSWDTGTMCGTVGEDQGQHRGRTKHFLEILKVCLMTSEVGGVIGFFVPFFYF